MFETYKRELRKFYIDQKQKHLLPPNLQHLGRLKLRNECIRVFLMQNSNKDTYIIQQFFDPLNKIQNPLKSIEKCDLDRFRPIVNYLEKGTNPSNEAAVKLLAWLLNYERYEDWRNKKENPTPEPDTQLLHAQVLSTIKDPQEQDQALQEGAYQNDFLVDKGIPVAQAVIPLDQTHQNISNRAVFKTHKNNLQNRVGLIAGSVLLLLGYFAFYMWLNADAIKVKQPRITEHCMYWTGTKYQPLKCDENLSMRFAIPMDIKTLNGFRKIYWSDRLTKNNLGEVWYAKINGEYEFFTDSGSHPLNALKKLKPLTPYILANHVSYHRFLLTVSSALVVLLIFTGIFIGRIVYLIGRDKSFHAFNSEH